MSGLITPRNIILLTLVGSFLFILSDLTIKKYIPVALKRNIVGVDVHKLSKPVVAEMGGLVLIAFYLAGLIIVSLLLPGKSIYPLTLAGVIIISGLIGLIDDLTKLGGKEKPLILMLCSIPLIFSPVLIPRVRFPFIGWTRLFYVYPLSLPVIISVGANSVNMLDVLNGLMPSSTLIVLFTLTFSGLLIGREEVLLLTVPLIFPLFAYYKYNKFPARVFGGDTGSLSTGAALTAVAMITKLEFEWVVATIPFMMNGFYIISSVGFKERRKIERPTFLTDDGKIAASDKEKTPITLVRLVVGRKPLPEVEVVKLINCLVIFSSILSVLTVAFT